MVTSIYIYIFIIHSYTNIFTKLIQYNKLNSLQKFWKYIIYNENMDLHKFISSISLSLSNSSLFPFSSSIPTITLSLSLSRFLSPSTE